MNNTARLSTAQHVALEYSIAQHTERFLASDSSSFGHSSTFFFRRRRIILPVSAVVVRGDALVMILQRTDVTPLRVFTVMQ